MMATELFKKIRKKGYLMVGYSLLRSLGSTGLVLERILTEYNHAIKHNLVSKTGYFGYMNEEIAIYIGAAELDVAESIEYLVKLGLIKTIYENNQDLIKVNEDEIYKYEQIAEIENDYEIWDRYLYYIQYNALKKEE